MTSPFVLVVEDDRSAADFLKLLLLRERYRVALAADGVEAMVALEANRFDLVISDLHMPNMNGVELLAHIRQRWSDLPVIIITTASDISEVVKVVKAGATNYLIKPVATPVVVTAVRKALNTRATATPPSRSIAELIGRSRSSVEVRHQVTLAARSAAAAAFGGMIDVQHLLFARASHDQREASPAAPSEIPRGTTLRELERRAILQALEDCDGNRSRAARLLDIDRSTLRRKLHEFGVGAKK